MTCGSITNGSTTSFQVTSNVGSTTDSFATFKVRAPINNAGELYGMGIGKTGYNAISMGVNKNTATNKYQQMVCILHHIVPQIYA